MQNRVSPEEQSKTVKTKRDCMRRVFYTAAHSLFYRVLLSLHLLEKNKTISIRNLFDGHSWNLENINVSVRSSGFPCALAQGNLCERQGLPDPQDRTGNPVPFSCPDPYGRATRGFSNFFFFILFGCAAVFFSNNSQLG